MKWQLMASIAFALCIPTAAIGQTPQAAIDSGDFAKAETLLQTMATDKNAEKAVTGLCGQAQIAMEKQDYAAAEKFMADAHEKAKKLNKKSGWHYVMPWLDAEIAKRQSKTDAYKEALQAMRTQLGNVRKAPPAWKGILEYQTSLTEEDSAKAKAAAEAAAKAFKSADAHINLGLAYLRLAGFEAKAKKASKLFDDAIKEFSADESPEGQLQAAKAQLAAIERLTELGDKKGAKSRASKASKDIEALGNPKELQDQLAALQEKLQ